jgi:hypothetical protein
MMGEIMLTSLQFPIVIVIPLKFDVACSYQQELLTSFLTFFKNAKNCKRNKRKRNGTTSVAKDENETKCVRDRAPCILRPLRNHF